MLQPTSNDRSAAGLILNPPIAAHVEAGLPLRVIIADDSVVWRHTMKGLLSKPGIDLRVASNGTDAWEMLIAEDVPTLAILDWVMPGLEGLELCEKIRRLPREHYIYTILLTSKTEKKDVAEGLRAGADDYITKPFDASELEARLLVARRILRMQEELVAGREAMKTRALHDSLTGLLNRSGIMSMLDQEVSRYHRTGEPFALMLVDIDHFKSVNDTYGHPAGDQVLAEVATRIKGCLRPYDSSGRYGGEEFLIIVPGCKQADAFQAGEKIRQAVDATPIDMLDIALKVTISVGICTTEITALPDALLGAADSALYRAKETGRNRTEAAATAEQASPLLAKAHASEVIHKSII